MATAFAILGALACLVVFRAISSAFRLSAVPRAVIGVGLLGLGAGPVLLCALGHWSSTTWLLGCIGAFGTAFAAALVLCGQLCARLVRRVAAFRSPDAVEPARRDFVRRMGTLAAVGLGFGSSVYGALFGVRDYETEHLTVPVAGLPRGLDGYRIVQLSDLHIGPYVGEPELRAAINLVRVARPDLIVLTGDLVDWQAVHTALLGPLIRRLVDLDARDGVAAVAGNHDHHAGVARVLRTVERAGGHSLWNDARTIAEGRLSLLGVDWGRNADLRRAQSRAREELPQVLLCHDPTFFEEARGKVALQLSGHTHGGQISHLGVNPTRLVYWYVRGLYSERGTHLYVNRGFGVAGPPLRIGSAPEVTVIDLQAG